MRRADGMTSVIVTAQGGAAVAAALWCAGRKTRDDWQLGGRVIGQRAPGETGQQARADALIVWEPGWPARGSLRLNIACPVLVIGGSQAGNAAAGRPRLRRRRGPSAPAVQLVGHVTWLSLTDAGADPRLFLDALGRWLGAYMYGTERDQLL